MKKSALAALLLLSVPAFSQHAFETQPKKEKFMWVSMQNITGFSAGYYQADFSALNNQLTAWGAKSVFPTSYYMVGTTGAKGDTTRRAGTDHPSKLDGASSLEFMLPQEVTIGSNDSLVLRMHGWHFMTSTFGKDVIPGKMVALVLAPGIDWGTMKINRTLHNNEAKYKNPFVSPLVRADLRFMFGKFAIGGRAIYRYDITHPIWKRREDGMAVLPGSKMTGLGLQVFIGWSPRF